MAGTTLALTAILQLLDLLDQASAIVSHRGVAAIGHYVLLRFPALLAGTVPLGVLAGAMLCFNRLASGAEMVALRATGASLVRIIRVLLPACVLIALVQLVLQAALAPGAERALSNWWTRISPPDASPADESLWFRFGDEVVSVGSVSADGRTIRRLMIVHRSPDGDLLDRIDAAEARFRNGGYMLRDVSVSRPDGKDAEHSDARPWPDAPSPANMIDVARPVIAQTPGRLIRILQNRWASPHGPLAAWTALDSLAIALLDPLLMVLLAAPLLLSPPRASGNGMQMLRVVALGLGYLGLSGLLAAMGESGALPPLLATTASPLLFGAFALATVLQRDAGA
ncbi:LptF/LptG family permease [Acetobacteraceae bacterium KSS8]|uniref:LptF/LptG family permease n=1 Tax=Endosaccharibacter trunci TaxID=2812733 RepID=A0ABT1W8Q0_9PROT|nr:LptF/LptG family permease [Acetobacteraceae bacterium KSS8]